MRWLHISHRLSLAGCRDGWSMDVRMAIMLNRRPGRIVDGRICLTVVVGMLHRARVLVAGHVALRRMVEGMRGSPLPLLGMGSARVRSGKWTAVRLSCNVMAGGGVCVRGMHRHRYMMARRAIGQLLLVCGGRGWVEVCSGNGIDSSPFVGATADAGGAIVRGWRMGRHGIRQKRRCWSRSSGSCRARLNSPRQTHTWCFLDTRRCE